MKFRQWTSFVLARLPLCVALGIAASVGLIGQRADAALVPLYNTSESFVAQAPATDLIIEEIYPLGYAEDGDCLDMVICVEPETYNRIFCIVKSPLGLWYLEGGAAVMERGDTLYGLSGILFDNPNKWDVFGYSDRQARRLRPGTRVDVSKWIDPLRSSVKSYEGVRSSWLDLGRLMMKEGPGESPEAQKALDDFVKALELASAEYQESTTFEDVMGASGKSMLPISAGYLVASTPNKLLQAFGKHGFKVMYARRTAQGSLEWVSKGMKLGKKVAVVGIVLDLGTGTYKIAKGDTAEGAFDVGSGGAGITALVMGGPPGVTVHGV